MNNINYLLSAYTCQPNIGCCPAIFSIVQPAPAPAPTTTAAPQPKSIVIQLQTCPSTNSQPISSCGSCPTGYICAPLLGACCPVATPPPVVITAPPATQPPPQPPMMVMLCPCKESNIFLDSKHFSEKFFCVKFWPIFCLGQVSLLKRKTWLKYCVKFFSQKKTVDSNNIF